MDTARKGFCALRVTESPHEWTWTQAEKEEMAQAILDIDEARLKAEARVTELEATDKQHLKDWCKLMVEIAKVAGDWKEHPDDPDPEADDPQFCEQYDPWEGLRIIAVRVKE